MPAALAAVPALRAVLAAVAARGRFVVHDDMARAVSAGISVAIFVVASAMSPAVAQADVANTAVANTVMTIVVAAARGEGQRDKQSRSGRTEKAPDDSGIHC